VVTNFVNNKASNKLLNGLLGTNFRPDQSMTNAIPPVNTVERPLLMYTTSPFVGGEGWQQNDALFISHVLLHPQHLLRTAIVEKIVGPVDPKTRVRYLKQDTLMRFGWMVGLEWLRVIKLFGYKIQEFGLMKRIFSFAPDEFQEMLENLDYMGAYIKFLEYFLSKIINDGLLVNVAKPTLEFYNDYCCMYAKNTKGKKQTIVNSKAPATNIVPRYWITRNNFMGDYHKGTFLLFDITPPVKAPDDTLLSRRCTSSS
jgi:hypothetical protein